jgi:triosephosphate isomerase
VKKPIIAANWKLYIEEEEQAKKLAAVMKRKVAAHPSIDVVLMPPAPFISTIARTLGKSSIAVGAQAISAFSGGAHTGYISAASVKEAGATWTLVGHSERRAQTLDGLPAAAENDDALAAEVRAAEAAGLKVMLCVGEVERDPSGTHFGAVALQLTSALKVAPKLGKLAIAYEPVWAIGKSAAEACKPADLEEMAIFIRRTLTELFGRAAAAKIPILYGGSVDASNARELLRQGGVSGFLVGRASTDAKAFIELLQSCKE